MTRQLLTLIALLLPLSALLSCSQVTQVEDDCTVTQYFDDELEFCRNCPPVTAPMCEAGCGYQFTTDNHGCQVAECDCGFCAEGSYFDADVYACVDCPLVESPECQQGCPAAGKAVDRNGCEQRVCVCEEPCPAVAAPACGDEGCCTVAEDVGEDGCVSLSCECPVTAPDGFYFDADGLCLACPTTEPIPEGCGVGQ